VSTLTALSPADGAEVADERSKLHVSRRLIVSTSTAYSLADNADLADERSRLHYFAEKDCLGLVLFWGYLRKSARSARDIGFLFWQSIESSCVIILSQITQIIADKRQVGEMKLTTITAVHAFLAEIKFRNKGNFVLANTESSLLELC